MITYLQLAIVLAVAATATALPVDGGITVTPVSPVAGEPVTIRIANRFGAVASLDSATITRTGNAFSIVQNVNLVCSLPANPQVASEFQVGPLAAGTYTVIAQINFIDDDPGPCTVAPVTQTAAFAVTNGIPALDPWMLAVLVAAVAMTGLLSLRRL